MMLRRPDRYTPPPPPPPPHTPQLRTMAPLSERPVSLGSPPTQRVDINMPNAPLLPKEYPPTGVYPPGTDIEMQPINIDRGESSLNTSSSTHGCVFLLSFL